MASAGLVVYLYTLRASTTNSVPSLCLRIDLIHSFYFIHSALHGADAGILSCTICTKFLLCILKVLFTKEYLHSKLLSPKLKKHSSFPLINKHIFNYQILSMTKLLHSFSRFKI